MSQALSEKFPWTRKVNPEKIWTVLVQEVGVFDGGLVRRSFITWWNESDWYVHEIDGQQFSGRVICGERRSAKGQWSPHLRIDNYSEYETPEVKRIVEKTNKALRALLVEAKLVEPE